jgi:hypothetical protein
LQADARLPPHSRRGLAAAHRPLQPALPAPWTLAELDHKVEQARTKGSSEDLPAQDAPTRAALGPSPSKPQAFARTFSETVPRPFKWLFQGRIPLGKGTVLDGDPDLGKSTVLVDIASRISFNRVM